MLQRLLIGALTFNRSLFEELRGAPDLMRRGMMVVLFVGLVLGLVQGGLGLLSLMNPDQALTAIEAQVNQSVTEQLRLPNQTPEGRRLLEVVQENLPAGFQIARDIQALPTTLPRPVGAAVLGLQGFLSRPLGLLYNLLVAVIFTHIAARWLGGQGSIQQMLGLGALSTVPNLLYMFSGIPALGPLLGFTGWLYGLVVLGVATAVAHRLDGGKAAVAVLLFPGIGLIAILLGCCLLFVLSISALGSLQ